MKKILTLVSLAFILLTSFSTTYAKPNDTVHAYFTYCKYCNSPMQTKTTTKEIPQTKYINGLEYCRMRIDLYTTYYCDCGYSYDVYKSSSYTSWVRIN